MEEKKCGCFPLEIQSLLFYISGYKTVLQESTRGCTAYFSTRLFSRMVPICVPDELLKIKVEPFGGCKKKLD